MRKCIYLLAVTGLLLLLWGCAPGSEPEQGTIYDIWYLNKEETKVTKDEYMTQTSQKEELIEELLLVLSKPSEDMQGRPAITGVVNVLSYTLEEEQLIIKFDEHYKELSPTTEILTRAAIVRTLTQISGIKYIVFQIREENLTDALGKPVGVMTADLFIDNAGKEINAYEKVKLRLYFADESGTRLVEAVRPIVYNTNISLEKLVVEQLILGPNNPDLYPVINPATKINSVTVKDGICYVNLNDAFLTQIYNVTADITIYAITNSLVELPNVNKVQISINGETEIMYRENVKLTTIFERDLELVGRKKEE